MESAERDILTLMSSVNSIFTFLFALAVIGLGIAVVRPINKNIGIIYAVGGAARVFGLLLDTLLHAFRPEKPEMNTILLFSSISTAIWLMTSVVFFGAIIFASYKLCETQTAQPVQPSRGAW